MEIQFQNKKNMTDIYKDNLSAQIRIRQVVNKANKQFNPSLNQIAESMSGEPNDRDSYDYAGTEQEKRY